MAFKRSAVRSRLSPPNKNIIRTYCKVSSDFLYYLLYNKNGCIEMENNEIKKLQKQYRKNSLMHFFSIALTGGNFLAQIKEIMDKNANIQRELLVEEVVRRLQALEFKVEKLENKILTDEADELFNYSLIKAAECHKKEQIIKMADIIIAAVIEKKILKDDAEVLLNIVSELNTSEAEAFLEIYETLKYEREITVELTFNITELSKEKYVDLIDRLIAKGLMKKHMYTSDLMWDAKSPLSDIRYQFTYYGVLFIKIIYQKDCKMLKDEN